MILIYEINKSRRKSESKNNNEDSKGSQMKILNTKYDDEVTEYQDHKNNETELAAVIAAAIAVSMGISPQELNIHSIKRISQIGPAWSRVGRENQVANKVILRKWR